MQITKVIWEHPSPGCVKVNTDWASRGNPGRSSIGFALRNEEGDLIYAFGREVKEGTNTEAEAKTILAAMRYCVDHDYNLIDLYTDSMLIERAVTREWNVPWIVAEYVERSRSSF